MAKSVGSMRSAWRHLCVKLAPFMQWNGEDFTEGGLLFHPKGTVGQWRGQATHATRYLRRHAQRHGRKK